MSAQSEVEWTNGDHLSIYKKTAAAYGIVINNNPMRYQWSNKWRAPTYIGGPGFAIGKFDTKKDAHDLVAKLLQKWNFLGLDDPYNDLELFRDIHDKAIRTLVFRQLVDNTPIYQSRVVFFFSNNGGFIGYSGNYIPPDNLFFVQHITTCLQNLGTLDDRGDEIVSCDRFFYIPDDLIKEDVYTIIPVFSLKSSNSGGMNSISILSDLNQIFYRKFDDT